MASAGLLLAALLLAILLYILSGFLLLIFRQSVSPLRHLRGPPSPSFFMGNLIEMHDQENNNLIARWEALYGSTFIYRGFIGGCRLMTTDPVAVAHILGHAYEYPKPEFIRDGLASMSGGHEGLITVEGETHRRQRKILAPAFSSLHLKSLSPIFWAKATQLRDIWLQTASSQTTPRSNLPIQDTDRDDMPDIACVDVLAWLGRATLDVIGLAGFGYAFDSLTDDTNELANAFNVIFSTARKFRVMTILQVWFPFLRRFRRNKAVMIDAEATLQRIGLECINSKRSAILEVPCKNESAAQRTLDRDLLSILIRSNISSSPSQRMSTSEVLNQISTFISAGHETTASAMTWCLYALVQNPSVQEKLRVALWAVEEGMQDHSDSQDCYGNEETEGEERQRELTERIERCEYLDWVVRESLRLHAPVTNTMRVCMRDEDEIPISRGDDEARTRPEGGYLDRKGRRRWGIRVKKWDIISIPIQAINKSPALWGEDAHLFRPERWAKSPGGPKVVPGLYSNTLTFLNGNPIDGNRACIGYKFALTEIKIFLYVLLKDIEFTMDPSMIIEKKVNVVTRPFVKSEPHLGNQLPLYIRRATAATPSAPSGTPPALTLSSASTSTRDLTPPPTLSPTRASTPLSSPQLQTRPPYPSHCRSGYIHPA